MNNIINKGLLYKIYNEKYSLKIPLTTLLVIISLFEINASSISSSITRGLNFEVITMSNEEVQQNEINGTVTDKDGIPLPGVSVIIKGSSSGTTTDFDGLFSIESSSGDTLVFSYMGMQTKEVLIESQTTINVILEDGAALLDEVVVVGYGTQKKTSITGAVATVKSTDLVKVPVGSISETLTGRVPGLITRQTSGQPGNDATSLNIRGFGSPLVLVDGIAMSLSRLDPNEIESISVLKDGAAAIYGSRGGNGVVLVTTKRGKEGKATISYHSNMSFQAPTKLPKTLNSADYSALLTEAENNDGLPTTFTNEDVEKYRAGNVPGYGSYDWYGTIYKDWTPMVQHNLNLRGGSEKVKYFASTGYLDQASAFKSGDLNYKRYNTRLNLDAEVNENLSVGFDLAYRREDRDSPSTSLDDTYVSLATALPIYNPILPDPTRAAFSGFQTRSPYASTQKSFSGFINDEREYLTGKLELKYKFPFVEGLSAKGTFSYYSYNRYVKNHLKEYDVWSYDEVADEYTKEGNNGRSTLTETFYKTKRMIPTVSFNYQKEIGDHAINALVLAEMTDEESLSVTAKRNDLISQDIPYLFAGSEENMTNGGSASEAGRASYVGRVNYNYKSKYFLEATMRADATHKFADGHRWGYFPSVSAGWRISEEGFIQDNFPAVNHLKLRASYSQAGDDRQVSAFKYISGFGVSGRTYIFGNNISQIIYPTALSNPNITWLDMTTYNVALEGRFWNGLLGFELDVFYRETNNLFGESLETYPSTFGAGLPKLNINSTDDRGFDLLLTHRNRINQNLSYNISANVGLARSKWVFYSEDPYEDEDRERLYKRTGNYTNRWIGYRSSGLFMTQAEIDNHVVDQDQAGNSTLAPGDIKYLDLNNDGLIDWKDQEEIGYGGTPDMSFGLDLGITYKNLSVSALFSGAAMSNVNITGDARGPFRNESVPYDYHFKYRWTPDPNDPTVNINPNAQLPAVNGSGIGTNPNNNKTSDFWLKDNKFLRLKNVNINYSLPQNVSSKIGFDNVDFYAAATNLFTFNKLGIYKDSFDPEGSSSRGGRNYPLVKTITFGIKVSM